MAIVNLHGKTKMVATKILQSPQGGPQFYRVAEVHVPSMEVLQKAREVCRRLGILAHAAKISSGALW